MKEVAIYETVFHPVVCEHCDTKYRWLTRKTHEGESFYVRGFLEKEDADQFRTQVVQEWKKAQKGIFSLFIFHCKEWFHARRFPRTPNKEQYEWQVYRGHPILVLKACVVEPGDQPGRVKVRANLKEEESFTWFVSCCEDTCSFIQTGMAGSKNDAFYDARIHIDNLPPS